MPSRETSYDGTTIVLHWILAGLVLVLWLIGTFLEDLVPKGPLRSVSYTHLTLPTKRIV